MRDTIHYCQFCGMILPPGRLFDCDGQNQHGKGNCEMRNGSGGRRYNSYLSYSPEGYMKIYETVVKR